MQNNLGVALIAHRGREQDLLDWWKFNERLLEQETIFTNLAEAPDRPDVRELVAVQSPEDGGEMKIGALVADRAIDRLVYLWNPELPLAHDVDGKALIRTAVHHDAIIACNRRSADHIVSSRLWNPNGHFPESGTERRRIALVAHDSEKGRMVEWCSRWREYLGRHELCGTGTTSSRIREATGLEVEALRSGPDGGDLQIGARIVEGRLDYLFFFWSTRSAQPHDVDVKALLRVAVQHNVVVACNSRTADQVIESHLFEHLAQA
jgi:methylglyoxal synthase